MKKQWNVEYIIDLANIAAHSKEGGELHNEACRMMWKRMDVLRDLYIDHPQEGFEGVAGAERFAEHRINKLLESYRTRNSQVEAFTKDPEGYKQQLITDFCDANPDIDVPKDLLEMDTSSSRVAAESDFLKNRRVFMRKCKMFLMHGEEILQVKEETGKVEKAKE